MYIFWTGEGILVVKLNNQHLISEDPLGGWRTNRETKYGMMARTSTMFMASLTNSHFAGEPANLGKYCLT